MKYSIILLMFLTIVGCNKDSNLESSDTTIYTLKQFELFVPDFYENTNSITFVNSNNLEMVLTLQKQVLNKTITHNGVKVSLESITYHLENNDNEIVLGVSGSISENARLGQTEVLIVSNNLLSEDQTSYSSMNIPIINNAIPEIQGLFIYHESLEVANKIYANVMESIYALNRNSYSKVFYTKTEGIIGFFDKTNEPWYLK